MGSLFSMALSIWVVSLIFIGIGMLVCGILKTRFAAFGKIPLAARLTGKQVAGKTLRESGIADLKGFRQKNFFPIITIRPIKQANLALKFITITALFPLQCPPKKPVPAMQLSSTIFNWVLLNGVFMAALGNSTMLLAAILLSVATVIFSHNLTGKI